VIAGLQHATYGIVTAKHAGEIQPQAVAYGKTCPQGVEIGAVIIEILAITEP
jgi:hypothetical protein